ncbi:hypothetical protein JA1_004559 [Spathaspora sp. JA1]|nr:hypothetical protein JA1_004559 [Spathaspora sp. JA1]
MTISTELPINTPDLGVSIHQTPLTASSEQFISPITESIMVSAFESPNTSGAFPPSNNTIELTPQILQNAAFPTPNSNDNSMIQQQQQVIYNSMPFPTPYPTPVMNFQLNAQYATPKKEYSINQPMSAPQAHPPAQPTWDGQSPIMSNFAPLRDPDQEAIGLGLSIEQLQVDQAKERYIQQIKQQEYHRLLVEKQNQLQEIHIHPTNPIPEEMIGGERGGAISTTGTIPELGQSDGDKSLVDATSPTTIDAVSIQSSPNSREAVVADEGLSEEERLFKEITMTKLKQEDVLGQFVDLEYEYPSSCTDIDQLKNFEFDDYFAIENIQTEEDRTKIVKEVTTKKKKPSPSSTKVTKKILKKSPSFTGNSSSPTFVVNQKWNKSSTDIQTKKLEAYSKANQLSFNEGSQKIPLFALSSHYSFVYENVDTIEKEETLTSSKSSNNVMIDYANFEKNSTNQLKSLESGLIEFKVDLKNTKK